MRRSPHNSALVLALVVAAALVGGLVAFRTATPDQGTRVAPDRLGFRTLDREFLTARFDALAASRRAVARERRQRAAASRVAQRWLTALAAREPAAASSSAVATIAGIGIAPSDPAARTRLDQLRRWADGIDPVTWSATVASSTELIGTDDGSWLVDGSLVVTVASAKHRTARTRIPVVLELAPPTPGGRTWRIRDVQVDAARTGLRAWADPALVHRPAVDAILPASLATQAVPIADLAQRTFASVKHDVHASGRVDRLALRGWDDEVQLRAALGNRRVADVDLDAPRLVEIDTDGDLLVHAPGWLDASAAQRASAMRAAMFRTLTAAPYTPLPRVLVDGVAAALASPPTRSELQLVSTPDGRPLDQLLVADPASELAGDAEQARAHVLGTWLLEAHSLAALDSLVVLRAAGIDPDRAVRRVLHATPAGIATRVSSAARSTLEGSTER